NNYLYRTGDLARWMPDGNIEFFGRIDHQVKIRGARVELGEIENRLLTYPGIKEVVVLARQNNDGDKNLCAYYVEDEKENYKLQNTNYKQITKNKRKTKGKQKTNNKKKDSDTRQATDIRAYLARFLPGYMIPAYYIKMGKIPLTPNGKIDRKALAHIQISNLKTQTYVAPRDAIDEKLTGIWTEVLGKPTEAIGIDDNFFEIGGHSLRVTMLVSKIHKQFNVKLPMAEIFEKPTIRRLSYTIKKYTRRRYVAIEPVEKKEYYNMTSAQKRLYILQQMELESTAYNMPHIALLPETISREKLEEIFNKLIQLHESLRTSFHTQEGTPVQKIHPALRIEIESLPAMDTGGDNDRIAQAKAEFFRPFDLAVAPLLRVGIVETTGTEAASPGEKNRERFMLIDMHHIITDGTSQDVLITEFNRLNNGEKPAPLKLQYKEYAQWQNSVKQEELKKEMAAYWLNRYPGELPVLRLPTDYPRPATLQFEGDTETFTLNNRETGKLKETAKGNDATLYMTLLGIYSLLLAKLSGQEDIIIGTPVAGRRHAGLENIIGMFVNTLPMRNHQKKTKIFNQYLGEVKQNTIKAFENQDYQFEELVEKLQVRRDTGRNPIFDVMFNLLEQTDAKEQNIFSTSNDGNTLKMLDTSSTAKFDLTLDVTDSGDRMRFTFEYSTKLFKPATIRRFITYFKGIMQTVCKEPHCLLGEIEIITEEEKKRIQYEFNDPTADYPKTKTIHQLFAEQAQRTPDTIGLVGNEKIKENKRIKEQLPQIGTVPDVGRIHESPLPPPPTPATPPPPPASPAST
ncbi:MAG: hypothetical protein GY757_22845, partial [bacterium]|nr:hypothetical protein [bacterium]